MGRRRLRVMLAAAAVLAQLGAGVGVVIDRQHDRQEERKRAAAEAAAARRAAAEATATTKERSSTPEGSSDGDTKGGGLFDSLLGALGLGAGDEGGAPSLPGLSANVLTSCGPALTDALPDSGPKLLPDGKESSQPAAEQLPRLAADVEELRGLRFTKVPAPAYVSAEEMARRVVDQTNDQLPPGPVAAEARILIALGALPAGADLAGLTRQALSSQVAGFYDPDTGDLVVRGSDRGSLDGQTRIILSHELDHALTDQALGLPVDDQRPAAGAEDAALARLALVEGDATLVMQLYGLAHVSLLEQLSGLTGAVASQEELARLPYYMQRSLTAPYLDGMGFACALYSAGGWDAVNQAYKNLPTTSAQVLFPERYRAGEKAVDPRDPPALGGSWQPAPVRALGAAELQWLFEAPGGDTGKALDHVTQRAAAWAGGEVHQWTDGARTATAVDLVQRAGETPLCATIVAWYTAAFPGGHPADRAAGEELAVDTDGQDAVVRCAGADVRVGIAPDLATARAAAR